MDFGELLGAVPLWGLFAITVAVSLLAVEVGAWVAKRALRHREKEPDGPLNSLVGAILGLLAFILAFAFGMVGSRFDTRRQLVLDEANAVGTTYLRAGLLPPDQGLEIRRLLREYAQVRLKVTPENVEASLATSETIHGQLWSQAQALITEPMDPPIRALFIDSLNDVIDLHESRKIIGLLTRLPASIWLSVYLLSQMAMLSVGYQVGMAGTRRLRGMPLVVAAFALVIVMIADVDRPGEGNIRVSLQPLADVHQAMLQDSP